MNMFPGYGTRYDFDFIEYFQLSFLSQCASRCTDRAPLDPKKLGFRPKACLSFGGAESARSLQHRRIRHQYHSPLCMIVSPLLHLPVSCSALEYNEYMELFGSDSGITMLRWRTTGGARARQHIHSLQTCSARNVIKHSVLLTKS